MFRNWIGFPLAVLFGSSACIAQVLNTNTSSALDSYNGHLRPQVHFSPPQAFMNDPNGMFRDSKGLWHLYYQYNPTELVAGNQHWGHATSPDLYHWTNHPIALYPTSNGELVFSGSAVIDSNNTSGFFPNQTNGVVAIYTLHGDLQTQNIAYSTDDGYTFTTYASNPVLDINNTQFRDPKVIWHSPTQKWVMVVSLANEFEIGIYTSSNLKEWEHQSNFGHAGLLGIQYECPNLIEIPVFNSTVKPGDKASETMWMMAISINPGAPLGGSISQYMLGSFNGTHFTALDSAARLTDFAKDNYAGQFFYGIPGDEPQVSIAWASNWQYAQKVPTASEGWRSAMSMPRLQYVTYSEKMRSYELVSAPYDMTPILDTLLVKNENLGNGSLDARFGTDAVASNAIYVDLKIANASSLSKSGTINVTLSASSTGESILLGQVPLSDVGSDFFLSRANLHGFGQENPFMSGKFSVPVIIGQDQSNQSYHMEMVFDRSLVEVFLQDGKRVGTMVVFPNGEMDTVTVRSGGITDGTNVNVEVWGLKKTWVS